MDGSTVGRSNLLITACVILTLFITARPGQTSIVDFSPSAEFPSLQYFDFVDENSSAGKAGLRCGDFLLEVSYLAFCCK